MNRWLSTAVALGIAFGALYAGHRLKYQGGHQVARASAGVEIPYTRTTAASVREYCDGRGVSPEDYTVTPVRGCPPRADAEVAAEAEIVAAFRNCEGLALVPRPASSAEAAIRLTRPQDSVSYEVSDPGPDGEKLPALPSPVRFSWDSLGPGVVYGWTLSRFPGGEPVLTDRTERRDMDLNLPPSQDGQWYCFRLVGFKDERRVGALLPRTPFCFRVIPADQ